MGKVYKIGSREYSTIILDLDGTLVTSRPSPNWQELSADAQARFYQQAGDCLPTPAAKIICDKLAKATKQLVYLTGRSEQVGGVNIRQVTEQWLKTHAFPQARLLMRAEGDFRDSHLVKSDLVSTLTGLGGTVLAIDDEDENLRMFSNLGFFTLKAPFCFPALLGFDAKPYGFIYCITNKINGRCYVGQTKFTIDQRWDEHQKEAEPPNGGYVLHAAIRKYGIANFSVEFVCSAPDPLTLDSLEVEHGLRLKALVQDGGYSLRLGLQHAVETAELAAKRKRPKSTAHKLAIGAAHKGKSMQKNID